MTAMIPTLYARLRGPAKDPTCATENGAHIEVARFSGGAGGAGATNVDLLVASLNGDRKRLLLTFGSATAVALAVKLLEMVESNLLVDAKLCDDDALTEAVLDVQAATERIMERVAAYELNERRDRGSVP